MSRIPLAEPLRLADELRSVESFAGKVAAAGGNMAPSLAGLVALHYEAAALINRLAVLVGRGGNSLLVDQAVIAIQGWNRTVREAAVLVTAEDLQTLSKNDRSDSS
ncbi:MAG: hypothetical protein HY527_18325 [Betaproteobacteria bacterium]|nr:hypothetical protein [Betaproteobacteria bacterium]